ncbi:MAG: hypothetical protein ACPGSG_11410 [Prolixibacteraceae bacterium]
MKHPVWFARYILFILTIILLMLMLGGCRAKKSVTSYEVKKEVETKTFEESFTGSEVEKDISKKTVEEVVGGKLEGLVPIDLEIKGDSTVIEASSDGVDLSITLKDGSVSYTVDAKNKGSVTEEIEVKITAKDTTSSSSSEENKLSLEEEGGNKEIRKPRRSWLSMLLLILVALAVKYRNKIRSFIP